MIVLKKNKAGLGRDGAGSARDKGCTAEQCGEPCLNVVLVLMYPLAWRNGKAGLGRDGPRCRQEQGATPSIMANSV